MHRTAIAALSLFGALALSPPSRGLEARRFRARNRSQGKAVSNQLLHSGPARTRTWARRIMSPLL